MDRADPPSGARIAVEIVYCPAPRVVDASRLELPAGATVADALRASGVLDRHAIDAAAAALGIWGRPCTADQALRDRDRVELYRPLRVDPKEARRRRQRGRRQGAAAP